jgi:NAD(P)-dependent dehydrogenase (short-subunit alcohol dehydrogenase family)
MLRGVGRPQQGGDVVDDVFSLEGRVAIVTGSGTGIGRATARVLAAHGADLVLAARRAEPLEQTAATIRDLGRRALVVTTDVTDADACEDLVAATLEEFGHVDVLVNNAGGSINKAPERWSLREWHQIIDVNLSSTWFLSRLVSTPMLARGRGAIVNISSGASFLALPMVAPYGAAKAGINSLTRSLAAAWTGQGVRVNAVACGAVQTEGYGQSTKRAELPDDAVLGPGNAIGRIGQPDEIAYPVLFFASDASSYCSGQTLWVNGGPKAPATT